QRNSKKGKPLESTAARLEDTIYLPFASGGNTEARLVFAKNGITNEIHNLEVGAADLFNYWPTTHKCARYPRIAINGIQKKLYRTERMLPTVLIGMLLLISAIRWKVIAALSVVPLYYLVVQSALHTEYRYILAIHYFLFVFAATTFYGLLVVIRQSAVWNWR